VPPRRFAFLADLADDVIRSVRTARARRRPKQSPQPTELDSAAEAKRRLDATRERLRSETPPRQD
jgi:hypothetical protein